VVDGALVYVQADGSVMAVPIDVGRRKITGRPVPVLDPVEVEAALNGNSAVFVSSGGALVAGIEGPQSQLAWRDRSGADHPITREARAYSQPRLSPDGRRIAVLIGDGAKADAWIYDLATGTLSRLTSVGTVTSIEWTRDGERIVYSAPGSGPKDAIWAQSVGGAAEPEQLVEVPSLSPLVTLAPDGRSLLMQSIVNTAWRVQRVLLDSSRVIRTYSASGPNDGSPLISPDGRWAALTSDESGRFEVYVRSYPEPRVKLQVSAGGARAPVWSADGSKLYYWAGGNVMEARFATSPDLRVIARDTAFAKVANAVATFSQANFDVSRDGARLVISTAESRNYPLVVVPNWRTELRERLQASQQSP
jgi:serine/threonine-protein kinase